MAETVLAKMAVEISANAANFTKQLNTVEGKLNSFANNLGNTAKSIGIAFGVQQVASFAFEVAKLAGEAEGVRAAFDRLPNSIALMNQLKEATAGTVSELDLMKRTVQASNFGIELEALPKLLEFAAIRAQQTGQSVDYLVDSIVTGIGRKSPLILDNLGISAVALKEKMGGVALATASIGEVSRAVGQIANDELEKMGGFSENASTKVQRLTASWEDFKVVLGGAVNAGGLLAGVLDDLTGILKSLSGGGDQADFIQFQKNLAESIKNDSEPAVKTMMRELNLLRNELKTPISESFAKTLAKDFKLTEEQSARFLQIIKEINGEAKSAAPIKVVDPVQITTLDSLQDKLKELNESFSQIDVTNKEALVTRGQEIISIGNQIKALEDLRKQKEKEKDKTFRADTVNAYQKALEGLNKEIQDTNVKDTDRLRILSAQVAGYEEAIRQVERLKNSFKDFDGVLAVPDLSGLTNPIKEIQNIVGTLTFTTLSTSMDEVVARFEDGLAKMAISTETGLGEINTMFLDFGNIVGSVASGVAQALGNAIGGGENFGRALLGVLGKVLVQLGEMLIAAGLGVEGFKTALKSLNGYVAIAAGAALIAIGTAVGASIKNLGRGAGGGGAVSSGGGSSSGGSVQRFDRQPADQVILVGGEIKWNGNTLALALDRAYKSKERTG